MKQLQKDKAYNLETQDVEETSKVEVCRDQDVEETNKVDANDASPLNNEHAAGVSSSKEEVAAEKGSSTPTPTPVEIVLVQASAAEEENYAECSENIHNERGNNVEKESIGARSLTFDETDPDTPQENMVLKKLLRGPRYFDYPEGCWPPSYGSSKDNAEDDEQKNPKKRKPCYICADDRHDGKRCKMVINCLICSQKGHLMANCPKKVEANSTSILCLKCGDRGHDMFSCGNEYDPEDLKHINCYICKEPGHLCCAEYISEGPIEATCYNCGESGHLGPECEKPNHANDYQPDQMCAKCRKRGRPWQGCRKCSKVQIQTRKVITSESKMEKAKQMEKAKEMEKDVSASKSPKVKKSRNARRKKKAKPMASVNTSRGQPIVPTTLYIPQVVVPYFGQPGSNVWVSPPAAARSRHQTQGPPAGQISHNPAPQIPFHTIIQQPHLIGTQIPQQPHHPETVPYPFHPTAQRPHLIWNSQSGAQTPLRPHLIWNSLRGAQTPQQSLYYHPRIQHPNAGTPTPPNSFYPMTQPPHLVWNRGAGTQPPQQILYHPAGRHK